MKKTCLILAAGSSTRYGTQKLVQNMHNGKPMLLTTIECYRKVFKDIVVVITPGASTLNNLLENQDVRVLECTQSKFGMGHSIACGIAEQSESDAVLIALGDMPRVNVKTVAKLYEKLGPNSIIAPVFQGVRGNPVGFGRKYFSELLNLQGDTGGRAIINNNLDDFVEIAVNDQGVLLDIDTPDQLESVLLK
jgi:molybdenum cofactor cytidylyltransferase